MRYVKKRSLKARIEKMISLINFTSLLTMLIAFIILFGVSVNFFGKMVSENIAKQMNDDFNGLWERSVQDGFIKHNIDSLNDKEMKIFELLGERYRLFNRDYELLDNMKQKGIDVSLEDNKIDITHTRLIEYEIVKGDEVIFFSENKMNNMGNRKIRLNEFVKLINQDSEEPLTLKSENTDLTLKVRLNPLLILLGYMSIIVIGIFIFFITHFIAGIITRAFSGILIKPLSDLDNRLNQVVEGNIEAAISTEIILKKPVEEVECLANSTNKIIAKMSEYIGLMEGHKEELEAQNIELEENSEALTSMNASLASKHSKLKNILNHVEQGFLTFDVELLIDDEYSLECERIFGKDISKSRLSNLLYSEDNNMQKFMDELLIKVFTSAKANRNLYLSLLPEEIIIKGQNISLTYKIVMNSSNNEVFMVILNDITEKRKLEKRMDQEKNILKMVVKSITNRNEFIQLMNEYKTFVNEEYKDIDEVDFEEFLRNVHNFKGNFSQFDMINIVDSLDDLESKLYEDKIYLKFALDNNEMLSWLKEDVDIIEAYVGKEFFKEEEVFSIKKTKLIEIEEKLKEVLTTKEFKNVLPIIKTLGYKSVKDILKNYPAYVEKLSERCNKSINAMEITGDDILVDTAYYRKLGKVLVHIFRNCVDHGIETEDERLEKGKEQLGTISCHIQDMKECLKIIISDNGRGIDTEGLAEKCIGLGLYTEEQIMNMTDKEKLNLVFQQGISTKEVATTISGRGVGMASVKECVQEMGGYIELESEKDDFTRFIITVPKVEENENIEITAEAFMKAMVTTTEDIVLSQTGIKMNSSGIEEKNLIELSKITALINLKGSINSIVMISANESMSRRLVEGFILEPLKDEEKEEYAEAVIGEICNNILGNTFGIFEDMDSIFHIGIPAMISNNGAYVKYTDSEILTATLTHEDYVFNISMLAVHNEERDFSRGDLVWQEY